MHNEKLPESPILSPELPHNLRERQELIKHTDLLVQAWAERNEGDGNRLLKNTPITEVIINDCIDVDDIEKEFERRNFPDDSAHYLKRVSLEQRIFRYKDVSDLANMTSYDTEIIQDEYFAHGISTLLITTLEEPEFNKLTQAAAYLRRLFVAREKLAALNGLSKFDTTYFNAVLDELYKEA